MKFEKFVSAKKTAERLYESDNYNIYAVLSAFEALDDFSELEEDETEHNWDSLIEATGDDGVLKNAFKYLVGLFRLRGLRNQYRKAMIDEGIAEMDYQRKRKAARKAGTSDKADQDTLDAAHETKMESLEDRTKAISDRMDTVAVTDWLKRRVSRVKYEARIDKNKVLIKIASKEEARELQLTNADLSDNIATLDEELREYESKNKKSFDEAKKKMAEEAREKVSAANEKLEENKGKIEEIEEKISDLSPKKDESLDTTVDETQDLTTMERDPISPTDDEKKAAKTEEDAKNAEEIKKLKVELLKLKMERIKLFDEVIKEKEKHNSVEQDDSKHYEVGLNKDAMKSLAEEIKSLESEVGKIKNEEPEVKTPEVDQQKIDAVQNQITEIQGKIETEKGKPEAEQDKELIAQLTQQKTDKEKELSTLKGTEPPAEKVPNQEEEEEEVDSEEVRKAKEAVTAQEQVIAQLKEKAKDPKSPLNNPTVLQKAVEQEEGKLATLKQAVTDAEGKKEPEVKKPEVKEPEVKDAEVDKDPIKKAEAEGYTKTAPAEEDKANWETKEVTDAEGNKVIMYKKKNNEATESANAPAGNIMKFADFMAQRNK